MRNIHWRICPLMNIPLFNIVKRFEDKLSRSLSRFRAATELKTDQSQTLV